MKALFTPLLLAALLVLQTTAALAANENVKRIAAKMMPGQSQNLRFEQVAAADKDFFELETIDGKLTVRGNTQGSMARGLNHYLRHYLHATTSWTGKNLPAKLTALPAVSPKLHVEATLPLRYYLNYCTYSYSMAYWDWERWEEEIDWMAMQGINMPLVAVNGQYAVWQNTLRRLGYTQEEILRFLPGPGYEAWWLMGNLEECGGPVSQAFIDRQAELQRKMLQRMREYGMEPVMQGFYGMVPNSLIEKYPQADIRNTGKWITYQRPAFIVPTDSLFGKVARIYYQEQEKLFGRTRYFGGDPFHEGGNAEGVNITAAATCIHQSMKEAHPQAVWVLQGWGGNPWTSLLKGLKQGEAVVLDLMACGRPQWGGVPSSIAHRPDGYLDHHWIWCALPNFGGRIGLYGKLHSYATGVIEAQKHPLGKQVCGVGTTPEGIGSNPMDYELTYDMAWQTDTVDVEDWINNYALYRYGVRNEAARKSLQLQAASAYNCPGPSDGPQESFFCARPSLKVPFVSTWGTARLYYQPQILVEAWTQLLKASPSLQKVDTYRYDAVDLTRQVLADYGKHVHAQIARAYQANDRSAFDRSAKKFLELIADQDQLLATRREFLLGEWIRQAASCGFSVAEKQQYVRNAKRQISTWASVDSDLHEYAHKEWNGMLSTLYAPRWSAYFDYLRAQMDKKEVKAVDFFAFDTEWINREEHFASTPKGNEVEGALRIYQKYITEINKAYEN
ncbi:MAG: alpha-N-acetylglucosaminidase [Bacteroides sp.]